MTGPVTVTEPPEHLDLDTRDWKNEMLISFSLSAALISTVSGTYLWRGEMSAFSGVLWGTNGQQFPWVGARSGGFGLARASRPLPATGAAPVGGLLAP